MRVRVPLLPGWLRWLAVFGIAAFIFYVSIVTAPPETPLDAARPDLLPLDKWRHLLAYAALGLALAYATTDRETDRRVLAVAVLAVVVLYGVGIEAGQSMLPDRYLSAGDAYANALGGAVVLPYYVVCPSLEFQPVREWLRSLRG